MKKDDITFEEYGNRQHSHMLGCGYAWFSGKYPDEWKRIRKLPAEDAIEDMIVFMKARSGDASQ